MFYRKQTPIANRKMRVQSSKKLLNLTCPTGKALKILKSLGAGNKPSDVAKDVGCVKSNVTYWIKRFIQMDAIKLQCHDVYDTYSFTPYGSKILTGSEELIAAEVVVLEDHAVKCVVVEHETVPINWVKLGEPRNWVKLGVKYHGVTVEKTSQHVIIHSGRLKGFDVDELYMQVGSIVQQIKDVLENRFGMVLGEPIPVHKGNVRVYSKEAEELHRLFGTITVKGIGSIDDSPPHGKPHAEWKDRNVAKEYLNMPMRLVKIESDVQSLTNQISELVTVLKESLAGRSQEMQRGNPFAV